MPPLEAVRLATVPPLAKDTGVERAIVPLVLIVPPVSPVPAVILVTVPLVAGAAHVAVPPETVSTLPLEPISNFPEVLTPVPTIKSPVAVIGSKALKAALAVVRPVPPAQIDTVPKPGAAL